MIRLTVLLCEQHYAWLFLERLAGLNCKTKVVWVTNMGCWGGRLDPPKTPSWIHACRSPYPSRGPGRTSVLRYVRVAIVRPTSYVTSSRSLDLGQVPSGQARLGASYNSICFVGIQSLRIMPPPKFKRARSQNQPSLPGFLTVTSQVHASSPSVAGAEGEKPWTSEM